MSKITLLALLILGFFQIQAQNSLYFPPATGTWQTLAPSELGFCPERIDSLYAYLDTHHSKGFLLLKDGKIVLEKYFDTFS